MVYVCAKDPNVYGKKTDDVIFDLISKGFKPKTLPGYGAYFPEAIPVSDSAKDLMSKLLTRDVAKRLTAVEALEHPWVRGESAPKTPLDSVALSRLKDFSANTRLKQAVLVMMADSLSEAELNHMRKTFEAIDTNHDGNITVTELRQAMDSLGDKSAAEDVERIMKMADVNGDGVLSYDELLLTAVDRKLKAKEERLWDTFKRLDLNGDGKISAKEIATVFGEEHAQKLISEVDVDGDGSIDIDEFVRMWGNLNMNQAPAQK